MKLIENIVIIAIILLVGRMVIGNSPVANIHPDNNQKLENVEVTIEKIQKVFKLVTIETNLSELYDYKEIHSLGLPIFEKSAMLKVNGRASIGYDFDKIIIDTDNETKTITIKNFPKAEILSLEHDLEYHNIDEGFFNQFTAEEYNRINGNAKKYITQKALDSDSMQQAREQKQSLYDMIESIVQPSGWNLRIEDGYSSEYYPTTNDYNHTVRYSDRINDRNVQTQQEQPKFQEEETYQTYQEEEYTTRRGTRRSSR